MLVVNTFTDDLYILRIMNKIYPYSNQIFIFLLTKKN